MMTKLDSLTRIALLVAGGAIASASASSALANPVGRQQQTPERAAVSSLQRPVSPSSPVVVAVSAASGALQYWPFTAGNHPKPTQIAGFHVQPGGGIAANGTQVAIANGNQVIVYDLQTKQQTVLPDPSGTAVDVAIGKTGAIYVVNLTQKGGNVVIYPPHAKPVQLNCSLLHNAEYIAVDNEGDVFLNQLSGVPAVIEIPNGSRGPNAAGCMGVQLKPGVAGYAAGIAIDPMTDNLLVLDDPDYCAGGVEGRLTTYRKPYSQNVGSSLVLGQSCSGMLRLDATSQTVLIGDTSVDQSYSYILESSYPSGKRLGAFGGGNPYGFTTIPNALPN